MPAAPFDAQRARRTLFEALLEAAREHGMTKEIVADADGQTLIYRRLI